jgi:serine protease
MKTKFIVLSFFLVLVSLTLPRLHSSAATPTLNQSASQPPTDQIIIRYNAAAARFGENAAQEDTLAYLAAAAGLELAYVRPMSGEAHVLKLPHALPEADVAAIAARLMTLPEVAYAEPDAILFPQVIPNDSNYSAQWHFAPPGGDHYGINAPAAWDIITGTAGIVVAVVDTGITEHQDLVGRTLPGYDFVTDIPSANDGDARDANPADPGDWVTAAEASLVGGPFEGCPVRNSSWHGTHVAGTIGAAANNSRGVAGINWNSKILPVRVLGKCGGYSSDIADGMRWAAGLTVTGVPTNTTPAQVLNLSLGGAGACLQTYQEAVDAITAAGATVVVSAGNENQNSGGYRPGNCAGVITVAATTRTGGKAFYSNTGDNVEISAPGGETTITSNGVLSTLNQGTQAPIYPSDYYSFYQGTSMAAPHVAGVASLLYSLNPTISPALVGKILQSTATHFPLGSACTTQTCGAGIVNAGEAVRQPFLSGVSLSSWGDAITQTQLTVQGANFAISSTILLSGAPITTTFISPQALRANLTISDIVTTTARLVSVQTIYPAGHYTSTSLGLFQTYLPLVTNGYGWQTVFADGFESGLSASWMVTDTTKSGYAWGQSACKALQGSASAWVLAGGSKGPAACGAEYLNSMRSWMIYGGENGFSLEKALAADVKMDLWINTETHFDTVCLYASTNGSQFFGNCYYGGVSAWSDQTLDLANVPTLGSLLGQPQVWVAVLFKSDTSTVRAEGAFVDNFIVRKCLGGNCTPPAPPETPPGLNTYPSEAEWLP